MRKTFGVILVAVLLACMLPLSVFAGEGATGGEPSDLPNLYDNNFTAENADDMFDAIVDLKTSGYYIDSKLEQRLEALEDQFLTLYPSNQYNVVTSTPSSIAVGAFAVAPGAQGATYYISEVAAPGGEPYALEVNMGGGQPLAPVVIDARFPETSALYNVYDKDAYTIEVVHYDEAGNLVEKIDPSYTWYGSNSNNLLGVGFATNSFSIFAFNIVNTETGENVTPPTTSGGANNGGGSTSPIKDTSSPMNTLPAILVLTGIVAVLGMGTVVSRKVACK